jgi:glycosyltransferase involved in cell wall biosynthesis
MRLGFICKFPPLTGGVASRTYWLINALAERGHEIHVITNANEIEMKFKESFTADDEAVLKNQKNLFIHSTSSQGIPPIRPTYNPFDIKIANLALKVIDEYTLDVLDSWFLIPNSVAAFMVKHIKNIPWVIRHGGSDLGEHLVSPHFDLLLKAVLFQADRIISHSSNKKIFDSIGIPSEKLWLTEYSKVNRKYFNESVSPAPNICRGKPVIMSIGKIMGKKGTYDLLQSFVPLKAAVDLVFITGGPGLDHLNERVHAMGLGDSVRIFPPVPPWRIPSYIRAATCVVHAEREFGIPHYPIIPKEVIACGKCLLLSEEMGAKYPFLKRDVHMIIVDPHKHDEFSEKLKAVIYNPALRENIEKNAVQVSQKIENYEMYISTVENFYRSLI